MVLCFALSSGELATVIGYSLENSVFAVYARVISTACISLFWIQEMLRIGLMRIPFLRYLRENRFDSALLAAMLVFPLAGALSSLFSGGEIDFDTSLTSPEIAVHSIIVTLGISRGIRRLQGISLSPGWIFILSFAALIYLGTALLLTPKATLCEGGLSFIDALFFATSAVCVTGLVPVESLTSTLSGTGRTILLVLFQLGGLGVMTITYFFAFFFDGGLSIRNRFAFGDLFSERNTSNIGITLMTVVIFTFAAEAVGAVAIYFSVAGTPAIENPVYFSVFHSVAAFCNAGFSTVPEGLANPAFESCTHLLGWISVLSVFGALGFPVVRDLALSVWSRFRRFLFPQIDHLPDRLSTHTRVVIVTAAIVSVAGTLFLCLTEGGDFGRMAFLAFSSRTAGFDIGDTGTLSGASIFVLMILMFIGGAPFSTAGGIKVTTFAIAVLALKQCLTGRRDLEIFNRRLDSDIANQALAVVILTLALFGVVSLGICVLHPETAPVKILFESVSAVATVGLSCGITSQLCGLAKLFLIFAMFIGRIGVLLFFASFVFRRNQNSSARFPETTITL